MMGDRPEFPTDGVFQRVAKSAVGIKVPYPLYEVPFPFRCTTRSLQYTLYAMGRDIGCNLWLKCNDKDDDGFGGCSCCPDLSEVEHLRAVAIVTADVGKPGDPVQ